MQEVRTKSIKRVPTEDRYDLTIESTHNFFANDILIHNTSSRAGNVLIKRPLSMVERIAKVIGVKIAETDYRFACGSRRVTKSIEDIKSKDTQHYYKFDIWKNAGEKYFKGKLAKGEIAFFEIVGWTPDGSPIQKIGNNVYNYGANENEYKIFVYRFTLTSEDGHTIEYTTQQVRERCAELGVEPVQEYYYGYAKDLFPEITVDENWHSNFANKLKETYLEKDCTDCVNVGTADEGVVLSIDARHEVVGAIGCEKYKLKSLKFLQRESDASDKGEVVDAEEGTEEVTLEDECQAPQK